MATTIFGWATPTVGGDNNAWGGALNDMFEQMDTDVGAIKDTADAATPAALPLAGGTLTGLLVLDPVDGVNVGTPVSASPSGSAVALDLNAGRVFNVGTYAGSVLSLNFSNRPVGGLHPVVVIGNYTGDCVITIDAGDLSYSYVGVIPSVAEPFSGHRALVVWILGS